MPFRPGAAHVMAFGPIAVLAQPAPRLADRRKHPQRRMRRVALKIGIPDVCHDTLPCLRCYRVSPSHDATCTSSAAFPMLEARLPWGIAWLAIRTMAITPASAQGRVSRTKADNRLSMGASRET